VILMANDDRTELAINTLRSVEKFFNSLDIDEKKYLPKYFQSQRKWMANYTGSALGIFFLSIEEIERVTDQQKNNLPPFPGFLISEDLRPDGAPVAFSISGSCGYYKSNHTVNNFAFSVKPGASFTVVDHLHKFEDSASNQAFEFSVDLSFILGLHKGERWTDLEPRLSELLLYTLETWKKL
jgi:hypothetical protein